MANQEIQENRLPPKERWEERTLNLLHDSIIDQEFSRKKRIKKQHKLKWMVKNPMAIPEMILQLQHEPFRESALRCLSNFLIEKREDDPEKYNMTGYYLYFSCSTMTILLQEVLMFHRLMIDGLLTTRACKRLINVLTLFQCIAANNKSRHKFVDALIPNYLIPITLVKTSLDGFENVRAVALSVIDILCQGRERHIIRWALQNGVPEASQAVLETGNELSKVLCMHILEAILKTQSGLFHIYSPNWNHLLRHMMRTWYHLIHSMSWGVESSPRILFHILRCYLLLCAHPKGPSIIGENLQCHLVNGSFIVAIMEFPAIKNLLKELLLAVGRTDNSRMHSFH